MIFLLFSFVFSYNKFIGSCYAILDQYEYDLRQFKDKPPYYYQSDSVNYIFRLCPNTEDSDKSDVFLLLCPYTLSSECFDVITQNSLNYKPRNPQNFSEGVIYYAESEPFSYDGKTYQTLDLEFDLICDPSMTSDVINFSYSITSDQFTLRGRTSSACPRKVASPTPTPVYEPDCKYTDRKDDDIDIGIDGDLSILNDGPFGIKTTINIDGRNKTLYFQPCERMLCPPTFSCDNDGFSSAWLCETEEGRRSCTSYGVGASDIDLKPVDTSLANGMMYRMTDGKTGKSVNLTLTCSQTFPEGHIQWSNFGFLVNETLLIGGKTKEFCLREIPTPTPQPSNYCVFNASIDNQKVSIDLENYNLGDVGWSNVVDVEADSGTFLNSSLIYQPCGPIICPKDTYCDGDEDAQVWLCSMSDGVKECIGYGLTKYNVSIQLADQTRLSNGLFVNYIGDNRRFADVTVYCDQSLQDGQISMPSYVTLLGRRLSFFIAAKDACPFTIDPSPIPSPSPTPFSEPWRPKKPEKPIEPTPTPLPSCNPHHLVFNETHFVELFFDNIKQDFFKGTVLVTHEKEASNLRMNWHPWELSECPDGFRCDEFDSANLWMCWTLQEGTNYCHPIADKRISLNVRLTETGVDEASNGVVLNYGGGYGFDTKLVVKCNLFESESFEFDSGADFIYRENESDPKMTVILDSKLTCARQFAKPTIPPTPKPTPPADPNAKVDREFTSDIVDGHVLKLDLSRINSVSDTLFIRMKNEDEMYRSFIEFNPGQVKNCPDGFTCVSNEKSSIWTCFNSSTSNNVCVPIGDDRFGIEFNTIKRANSNLLSSSSVDDFIGISAKYSGGYDGIESTINFLCNYDASASKIEFNETAEKVGNSFIFTIETEQVCPVKFYRNGVSGGAVFLLIVVAASIAYLLVGVLVNFVRDGIISIPNPSFWNEFKLCLLTAIEFIFCCGKKSMIDEPKYDAIN